MGGVYCTRKTEDRKIMSDYMIVWLNQTPVEFAVSLSKVDSHCGVIRASKGEIKNKGIRFEKGDYLQAFAILKPDEKLPQIVLANHLFKIAPTPLGSTLEQVQTWLSAQTWDAKPVKPLSGNCWLCVSERKFDTVFAQWNGSPVLIKWIEDKKDHAPIILAGDVQRKALANVTESVRSAGNVAASNPVEDPWSAWISSKGGTGHGSSGMQGRSTPVVQPPRKLESPIEDRFARHDSAVQDLKQHTEHELGMLKESIAKIERSIEMQNANIQSNQELTNAEFKSLRTETSQQLEALTGAFTESLKSTIAAQETQLATQFAELKDMIKRRTGSAKTGTSPPQKKSKTGDGDESL